jgi:hypothetical protein
MQNYSIKGEIYLDTTLKNYEIINAYESIKSLLSIKGFSTKLNYNLNKNLIKLEPSYKTYVASEQLLIDKYALKNEDGSFKLDKNKQPEFDSNSLKKYMLEREELLNYEDNITLFKLSLSSFPDNIGEGIILRGIMFLIDENE